MLFQLLHHDLDGFFQLRVMALSVSCGIKTTLEKALGKTQTGMEKSLGKITLAELLAGMKD